MNDSTFAGRHLMIDAYVDDPDVLRDVTHMDTMLRRIAEILKMDVILGPVNKAVSEDAEAFDQPEFKDSGGVTGFCVVSTSHLAYHTWPLKKFLSMDIFSCKDFDPDATLAFLLDYLHVSAYRRHDIVRMTPDQN